MKWMSKLENIRMRVIFNHTSAYAAQTAYFLILSLIPFLLLLLTMVRYTPLNQEDITSVMVRIFPDTIDTAMVSIIEQVYRQSQVVVPMTVLVTVWSAAKGVLALTMGLNTIYERPETRNYLYLRIRAAIYTILFLLMIVLMLVLMVFGNWLAVSLSGQFPYIARAMNIFVRFRVFLGFVVAVSFSMLLYHFLPNRKMKLIKQLPGSFLSAIGWILISFVFSIYLEIFKGFSNMYGSLTTIVLLMLWVYFCMYITLLGGIINVFLEQEQCKQATEERV